MKNFFFNLTKFWRHFDKILKNTWWHFERNLTKFEKVKEEIWQNFEWNLTLSVKQYHSIQLCSLNTMWIFAYPFAHVTTQLPCITFLWYDDKIPTLAGMGRCYGVTYRCYDVTVTIYPCTIVRTWCYVTCLYPPLQSTHPHWFSIVLHYMSVPHLNILTINHSLTPKTLVSFCVTLYVNCNPYQNISFNVIQMLSIFNQSKHL